MTKKERVRIGMSIAKHGIKITVRGKELCEYKISKNASYDFLSQIHGITALKETYER